MFESGKGFDIIFKNDEKLSYFDIIYKRFKDFIFEVQFLVLKYQTLSSIWLELFSIVVQLFQYLSYSFSLTVRINFNYSLIIYKNQKNYFVW